MNAKRQTIWLVSMLSLMVVLSAYYLFTEDVNKLDLAATDSATKPQEVKIDMTQADPSAAAADKGKTDVKATTGSDAKTDAKSTTSTTTKTDAAAASKTPAADASKSTASTATKTDDQILKQVEEQVKTTSASDYFTNEQMKQHDLFAKKSSDLLAIITDPKQTPDAVAKAENDLQKFSDLQDKVDYLQDELMKDFPQAIVNQDGNQWKVTVQSEKLEKSQGVTIVDMIIKELGAAPENIKIQYVRP